MMKFPFYLFLLLFLFLLPGSAHTQDPAFHLHFLHNNFHNPASAALGEEKVISTNYRRQWDSAIKTSFASFEMPLQKINSGTGFNFILDEAGLTKQYDLGFFFNYQLRFSSDIIVRLGVQPTIKWQSYNFGKIIIVDPTDPLFNGLSGTETAHDFNLNTGISFSWRDLHFGLGVRDIFLNEFKYGSLQAFTRNTKSYYFHLSQALKIHEKWDANIAAIYRKFRQFRSFDIAPSISFNDHFKLGASCRPTSDLTQWGLLAGIHFSPVELMVYFEPESSIIGRTFEGVAQFSF